eukprot:scaffold186121_cov27-Tisochrysis_lutea.AAC.1
MNVDFSSLFERAAGGAAGRSGEVARQKRKQPASDSYPRVPAGSNSAALAKPKKKHKNKKRKQGEAAGGRVAPHEAKHVPGQLGPSTFAPSKRTSTASKLKEQLAGARFRDINEQLYTQDSMHAVELFGGQPELYHAYHEGFRLQARGWPVRPVDTIVDWLNKQPRRWVIADIGCGDAEISERVKQKVLSFDLVAGKPHVTACDAASLPLPDGSLDAAIFCLALMGSNYVDFLREAYRVLKLSGMLRIAEVSSRFHNIDAWVKMMTGSLGFELVERDESNTHFLHFLFRKVETLQRDAGIVPLKPCLYKRR